MTHPIQAVSLTALGEKVHRINKTAPKNASDRVKAMLNQRTVTGTTPIEASSTNSSIKGALESVHSRKQKRKPTANATDD